MQRTRQYLYEISPFAAMIQEMESLPRANHPVDAHPHCLCHATHLIQIMTTSYSS
jgi:hypothetical protein